MKRTRKGGVGPSAPMHDDGGAPDPVTLVQKGGMVAIRGTPRLQFPVVGHCRCGCTTVLAQTVIDNIGQIFQRPFKVFTCTLDPVVPTAPAIPAGALDGPKLDPNKPRAADDTVDVLDVPLSLLGQAKASDKAPRVARLKIAEPPSNGKPKRK